MDEKEILASRRLSKINLNLREEEIVLKHYWCNVVCSQYDRPNLKEHWHSFFEMHLCLAGSCELEVQGEHLVLNPNEYLLLNPKTRHRIVSQSADFLKFVWGFSVQNDPVANALIDHNVVPSVVAAAEDICHAIYVILRNSGGIDFEYHNLIRNQLYYIFVQMVRHFTELQTNQSFQKNTSTQMWEIRKYILDNLSISLSVADICDQFFLSRKQLTRMCMEEYKMTFLQLKHSLQREKICHMLAETDATLEEIAVAAGFADKYSMSKFFHKQEGMPPVKYRKSAKA